MSEGGNVTVNDMKKIKVAINGFGRVGRAFMREAVKFPDIQVVAINDLGSVENFAYLLKYDTAYGRAQFSVETKDGMLLIDGKSVKFLSEKDPAVLPWKDLEVDIVVESTGVFNDYEKSRAHITAGAKRVVITGPVKGDTGGATILMGVNAEKLKTC